MRQWPLQTIAAHNPSLLGLMFDAPLVGLLKRWPDTLHAVEMKAVIDGALGRGTFRSACGRRGLRLLGQDLDGSYLAARWPPRLRGMPKKIERCRECWLETGRMRPRTEWEVVSDAS